MSDTTDQIEREVEMRRAEVSATLDRLKSRTSLDALLGEMGDFLHVEDARQMLHSAGHHVRRNPAAIALVTAGLGWIVFGGLAPSRDGTSSRDARDRDRMYPPHPDDSSEGTVDRLTSSVSEAAGTVRETVGSVASTVSEKAAGALHETRSITADLARQAQGMPLVAGSAMAILGAVIAAALPRTETESSFLDGPRKRILQEGDRAMAGVADVASRTVSRSASAAREAAAEEGLWPEDDGQSLGEKLGTIAEAAVEEAQNTVRDAAEDEPGPEQNDTGQRRDVPPRSG